MGSVEVFTFEVRPYVYGGPADTMTKTLKIMVQVNGVQVFSERVMPMQPANQTEIEYYTERAVQMLHAQIAKLEAEQKAEQEHGTV